MHFIEPLETRIAPATFELTTFVDSEIAGSLRQLILDANASPGPDTIEIRASGVIRLAADLPGITDDLQIVAARGKSVILNGLGIFRILEITGDGTDVTLENLKFTRGIAEAGGALAIDATGGTVLVKGCLFTDNRAVTFGQEARGGAIDIVAGDVSIENSIFSRNIADGRSPDVSTFEHQSAFGGAIANAGKLTLTKTTLTRNLAIGVEASGGAIFNAESSSLAIGTSTISANTAQGMHGADGAVGAKGARGENAVERGEDGGPGGDGEAGNAGGNAGFARGGAICNAGAVQISASTIAINSAKGGSGGDGGNGGAGGAGGRGLPMRDCLDGICETFGFNGLGGSGGAGGDAGTGGTAEGGAIYNAGPGSITIRDTDIVDNAARAGAHGKAGRGGSAASGGVRGENGVAVPSESAPLNVSGGGILNRGALTIEDGSIVSRNIAVGENVWGGGIANASATASLSITASTITKNFAAAYNGMNGAPGANGANGLAGAVGQDGEPGEEGAAGGDGTRGGDALGGAIYNLGVATIGTTTIAGNIVDAGSGGSGGTGGKGGNGGAGGKAGRDPDTGDLLPAGLAGVGASGADGGAAGGSGDAAGAGIYNVAGGGEGGSLTVANSTVSGNVTRAGIAGQPGAGGAAGTGDRTQPAQKGATGPIGGRGDAGGAGIFSSLGTLAVVQSTIAGNVAAGDGGGLKVSGADGDLSIRNSTIARNIAVGRGGGLYADITPEGGSIEMISTIVAKNAVTSKAKLDPDFSGAIDGEFNLIGVLGSATITGANNLTGADPKLGVLKLNGGDTATMLPAASSPVLDKGLNLLALAQDQRGASRTSGAGIDIGAVEVSLP